MACNCSAVGGASQALQQYQATLQAAGKALSSAAKDSDGDNDGSQATVQSASPSGVGGQFDANG